MDITVDNQYIAFDGHRLVGAGSLVEVARAAKGCLDAGMPGPLLLFDQMSSEPLELDLRGSMDDVMARLPQPTPAEAAAHAAGNGATSPGGGKPGPGRPRLGVVAREITLLPRHWQWLSEQPGGASVTIRRLVEEARTASTDRDRRRRAQESAYRFMSTMLGNEPGFEEATRALFAGDTLRFEEYASRWPRDLREHATRLARAVFDA
jgi:hypothetical protein